MELNIEHFVGSRRKSIKVIVDTERLGHEDEPPRQGRLSDVIYDPYAGFACPPWPAEMPTAAQRLHSKSYDCWDVVTVPAQRIFLGRVRDVLVCDPYDRFRHGSNVESWAATRRAELRGYGLSDREVATIIRGERPPTC